MIPSSYLSARKPVARICIMHKTCTRFFVDYRENSKIAVKGVPFLPFFVGIYGGTFFQEQGGEPNDMKSPQGQKHETAGSRIPAIKSCFCKHRKYPVTFMIFVVAPTNIVSSSVTGTAQPTRSVRRCLKPKGEENEKIQRD